MRPKINRLVTTRWLVCLFGISLLLVGMKQLISKDDLTDSVPIGSEAKKDAVFTSNLSETTSYDNGNATAFVNASYQLDAPSKEPLDKEVGYKNFKLGKVMRDVSNYRLDSKRSTKQLTAYLHKGDCCTEYNSLEIDGIVLYLNQEKELSEIEFLLEDVKSIREVGEYMAILQNRYGKVSNHNLAKKGETTSSFVWKNDINELMLKMTATDESKEYYYVDLFLQKK